MSFILKNNINIAVIILAAGNGKRMHSSLPKVMHQLAGQPLIEYLLQLIVAVQSKVEAVHSNIQFTTSVVVNDKLLKNSDFIALMKKYHKIFINTVLQENPCGTGHAVLCALQASANLTNTFVLILYGDTPLIEAETIEHLIYCMLDNLRNTGAVNLAFIADDPMGYGRIKVDGTGNVMQIIEENEATDSQKQITLCNAGIMLAHSDLMYEFLTQYNASNISDIQELYLTKYIEYVRDQGMYCKYIMTDQSQCLGVNNLAQLSFLENIVQQRLRNKVLNKGIRLIAPQTVFLSYDTVIEPDAIVYPYVFIGREVQIGSRSIIFSFSHIEGAKIASGVTIGPFARIRPHSEIMEDCRIGNFVEVKNSNIRQATKASHLSYIGDVDIGMNVNIGAGTVFCNFDGINKHTSKVDCNAFIGANTTIISPIDIGKDAKIGAGSVITTDVPDATLAVARTKQENKLIKNKSGKNYNLRNKDPYV